MVDNAKVTPKSTISDVIEILGNNGHIDDINMNKYLSISQHSVATQKLYISVLVWLVRKCNGQENKKYIANLGMLMTRAECSAEVRKNTRSLLHMEQISELPQLMEKLNEQLRFLEKKSIKFSLVKDALWLIQESEGESTTVMSNEQLKEFIRILGVKEDQIAFIEEASALDKKILSGEIEDSALEKMASDLAARAATVGVPIAAIYLSGSVIGLSAAGITSGLAALGFGGILGLSSMVTGIGVLIVLSTLAYQGVKYTFGAGERRNISKRELMLREILVNHQQTIASLAEDIFLVAKELKSLLINTETNRVLIDKIIKHISMTESAAAYIQEKKDDIQEELDDEVGKEQRS